MLDVCKWGPDELALSLGIPRECDRNDFLFHHVLCYRYYYLFGKVLFGTQWLFEIIDFPVAPLLRIAEVRFEEILA